MISSRPLVPTFYILLATNIHQHFTSADGFACDFGTLNDVSGTGLHDCDVTQAHNSRWRVISGADYGAKYWLDTTWKKNGGFFISWARDENSRSLFRLPHFQMSTAHARLSFYYKLFGTGQSRLRVKLCNDVIFDVTNKNKKWIKSPDLEICCYANGWHWPDISFEVTWNDVSGRIALDRISVAGMVNEEEQYGGGGCMMLTSTTPTTISNQSPALHPLSTNQQSTKDTTIATHVHESDNDTSALANDGNTDMTGVTAFTLLTDMFNTSDGPGQTEVAQQRVDIDIFDVLKTFPTNLAFFIPSGALLIMVLVIVVYVVRRYCCRCCVDDVQGKRPGSLTPEEQGPTEVSTYQAIHEPCVSLLQGSEVGYIQGLTSDGVNHDYSECHLGAVVGLIETQSPLPIKPATVRKDTDYRFDHSLTAEMQKRTTIHRVPPKVLTKPTRKPIPHPKPKPNSSKYNSGVRPEQPYFISDRSHSGGIIAERSDPRQHGIGLPGEDYYDMSGKLNKEQPSGKKTSTANLHTALTVPNDYDYMNMVMVKTEDTMKASINNDHEDEYVNCQTYDSVCS